MVRKTVAEINQYEGTTVNPIQFPEQVYELYSVPSFDTEYPEIIAGADIGSSKVTVQEGDVLICKINPRINRVWVVKHNTEHPLLASSEWIVVRNPGVDSDYLRWYFSSPTFRTLLNSEVAGIGGSLTRAQPKRVAQYTVPICPFEEQQRISTSLNQVESLISLRKQQIAKLDELVKARFVEILGNTKSNIQRYPVVKIGSCAKLQGGFAFKSADYLENGIRLVQISNVNKDTLDWDSINCVPQAYLQKYKDFELHVGDIVLAMTRPVIKSLNAVKIATVSENDVPSLLNQRVGRFIIDDAKLNPLYLMLSCQMPEFRDYVEAMSGNSLQPNISSKQVEEYSIVLPPLALQEEFAAFVTQTDKQKLTIQASLAKLETLKKALMQKYFG